MVPVSDASVWNLHGIVEIPFQLLDLSPDLSHLRFRSRVRGDGPELPKQLLLLLDQEKPVFVRLELARGCLLLDVGETLVAKDRSIGL